MVISTNPYEAAYDHHRDQAIRLTELAELAAADEDPPGSLAYATRAQVDATLAAAAATMAQTYDLEPALDHIATAIDH